MQVEFNIQPRQSGKTETIFNEYRKQIANQKPGFTSLLIVKNNDMLKSFASRFGTWAGTFSMGSLKNFKVTTATKFETIFIDEYLFFSREEKHQLRIFLEELPFVEKVVIYTTSNKLYNKQDIEDARLWKSIPGRTRDMIAKRFMPIVPNEEWFELQNNLLTFPDVTIKQWTPTNVWNMRLEILGEIWK